MLILEIKDMPCSLCHTSGRYTPSSHREGPNWVLYHSVRDCTISGSVPCFSSNIKDCSLNIKDCSLNVVMHSHASPPSHPARLPKFDRFCCHYKPVVQRTEGCDVWAHFNFVSNPSEFRKCRPVWSGIGDVISQFYRPWCRSVCSEHVKSDVSILEFNKCQSVPSKVIGITFLSHRVSQMFADCPFGSHHEVGVFHLTSTCCWLSHTTESY